MQQTNKLEKHHNLFKDIVLRIAQESHCESKKVAAIAVKDGRIISTGINGTPSGYINCDDYFKHIYLLKKYDLNIKGISSYEDWIKTDGWREEHHQWSNIHELHSEQNLCAVSSLNGISLRNTDIYISLEPCIHCVKLLAALKPNNIYYVNNYDKSNILSRQLLKNININIEKI